MPSTKTNKEIARENYLQERGDCTDEQFEHHYANRYESLISAIPKRYRDVEPKELKAPKDGKNGLYIWGGVGTGKTHMLYAHKKERAEQLRAVRIINVSEMLHEIKSSFDDQDQFYRP